MPSSALTSCMNYNFRHPIYFASAHNPPHTSQPSVPSAQGFRQPLRHDDCAKQSRLKPSVLCEIPNFLARPAWQDHYLTAICDDEQIVDAVHRNANAVGVDEVPVAGVYANGTR